MGKHQSNNFSLNDKMCAVKKASKFFFCMEAQCLQAQPEGCAFSQTLPVLPTSAQ